MPDGTTTTADATGHAELWWPRGLSCDLFVRAIIEREGFMRSGGVVIGGATTRLASYRYEAGTNDAADATARGEYPAAEPIRIQWNTPLPGTRSYPVRLVLELETTYDDGTVRTSQVSGPWDRGRFGWAGRTRRTHQRPGDGRELGRGRWRPVGSAAG